MRIKKLFVSLVLGLGLTLALLWLLVLSGVEGLGGGLAIVRAASFTVDVTNDENDGSCAAGDCSLREAIIAANGNGQADIITLGSGTHVLTLTGTGEEAAATGDLDITQAVTITGAGPTQTIIDASGLITDRVFDLRGGAGTVVISGVTIINGNVTGDGGGIYDSNADLTLINTVVSSNTATNDGGGVYVNQGTATLIGGQIVSNTASGNGGGVYVLNGSATLEGGQILSNTATWGGGGMFINRGNATLSGGQILSNTANGNGGGVYVNQSSATFTQTGVSTITHNTAQDGGGVFVSSGSATLSGGQIVSNTAQYGGGVYVDNSSGVFAQTGDSIIACNTASQGGGVFIWDGSATLSGGQVLSNTADAWGGGVYVVHDAVFTQTGDSIIAYNASERGGGVSVGSGSAVLSGAQIISNTAKDQGGGVWVYEGSATLSRVQVISNTASEEGGGIYNNNGTLTLVNTTVSRNAAGDQGGAGDRGGGLYNYTGTSVLSYTTVASNTASWFGGISYGVGGTILLKNTIVAYNSPSNCSPGITSNGHNLDSGSTCGFTNPGDQQNTDPLLGPLADNGGDTLTHALLPGSPAIDAGLCLAGITTDQRGYPRPNPGSSFCDIGAYEADAGGTTDLILTKMVAPTSAEPGSSVTYILAFSHTGPSGAVGVVITDIVPVSVAVQSVVSSGVAITDTGASPGYVWQVQDLAPGEGGVITITGVLSSTGLPAGIFTNTGTIGSTAVDSDTTDNSSAAGVTVLNVAPVAMDDSYSTSRNTSLTVAAPGVLGNDGDANGDQLTAVLDSGPASGTLALAPDGSFTYTPTLGFDGMDAFTYHANDGTVNSGVATVAVTVTPGVRVYLPLVLRSNS